MILPPELATAMAAELLRSVAMTTAGVLTMLGEPVDRQAQAQVGRILRALGWRRERVGNGVRRICRYLRPS